ncbi:hypothetical protein NMY22_g10801 [Coprinellus aureogranulatus]|nr:hypothetical protein NMY22_g10801 [Coprinellus aureogranulatus]
MSEEPLTFNQAVAGIAEFIEIAIHTILYVRQIYPPDLFIRRKKYDTPVFQSRHPALNEYIAGAVKALEDEMTQGAVEKVVVVIKNKEHVPMERFIFSIENMVEVPSFNKGAKLRIDGAMTASSLTQYFRSFLIKLSMVECQLGQMYLGGAAFSRPILSTASRTADNVSFAILLELRDDAAPQDDPPPWIPADTQQTTAGASEKAELHMIRAVNTGVVNLSLAVQESGEKVRLERERLKQERLKARKAAESKRLKDSNNVPKDPSDGQKDPSDVQRDPSGVQRDPSGVQKDPSDVQKELENVQKDPSNVQPE